MPINKRFLSQQFYKHFLTALENPEHAVKEACYETDHRALNTHKRFHSAHLNETHQRQVAALTENAIFNTLKTLPKSISNDDFKATTTFLNKFATEEVTASLKGVTNDNFLGQLHKNICAKIPKTGSSSKASQAFWIATGLTTVALAVSAAVVATSTPNTTSPKAT